MFQRWLEIPSKRSVLIVGSRRSGKTTLLKHRYPEWPYATLDDLDYLDWAKRDPKGLISHLGTKAIIDEIQRLPLLTVAVKYAVDNEKALFLITGSSTLGLLDAAADSLAGRIDIVSLPTACWGEELGGPTHSILDDQASPPQIKEANRNLSGATTYGQFPEVLIQEKDSDKHEVLVNYRSLNAGVGAGQLLENFVVAEFEKRRKLGMIKADQFYYYKSTGGNEIDLVFEEDNTVYAIEIKSTQRPAPRDLHNLGQFSDRLKRPVRRYLVYLGEEYRTIDNIQLLPVAALFRGM
jgi:predicted AAA+ superfamily ATPase